MCSPIVPPFLVWIAVLYSLYSQYFMFVFMCFFNFVVLVHHLWARVGTAFAACVVPQLRHGVTFAEMMADPTIS